VTLSGAETVQERPLLSRKSIKIIINCSVFRQRPYAVTSLVSVSTDITAVNTDETTAYQLH